MIPKQITIHHSASRRDTTTLDDINSWHKARFNFISSLGFYVAYHYLVLSNGEVKQCRRDNELGAHSPPNDGKIGVCLTGNFNEEEPTDAQIKSLETLVTKLKKDYNMIDDILSPKVRGHREFNKTECPGINLHKWVLLQRISWLKYLISLFLKGRK